MMKWLFVLVLFSGCAFDVPSAPTTQPVSAPAPVAPVPSPVPSPAPPAFVPPVPPSLPPIVMAPRPVPFDVWLLWEIQNDNGTLVVLLGVSTQGVTDGVTSLTYTFGDGSPSETLLRSWTKRVTTTHRYAPGLWTAGVVVTDGAGRTATDHKVVRMP